MIEIEDREFFDELYQQYGKTTGAGTHFWMPEEFSDRSGRHRIYAVEVDEKTGEQTRKLIASDMRDADADFIAGVHGCVGDLIRRLHIAVDEADRKDYEKDELEGRVAELEREADEKERDLEVLSAEIVRKDERLAEVEADLRDADQENAYLSARLEELEEL